MPVCECRQHDVILRAGQSCLLDHHRAVVVGVQIREQTAEPQAHRAGDHADVATSGPFARRALDALPR